MLMAGNTAVLSLCTSPSVDAGRRISKNCAVPPGMDGPACSPHIRETPPYSDAFADCAVGAIRIARLLIFYAATARFVPLCPPYRHFPLSLPRLAGRATARKHLRGLQPGTAAGLDADCGGSGCDTKKTAITIACSIRAERTSSGLCLDLRRPCFFTDMSLLDALAVASFAESGSLRTRLAR